MSDKNRGNVTAIDDIVDQETIDTLARLLRDACAGTLVGLAYVAAGRKTLIEVGGTGVCLNDPFATLGMVRMLDEHIAGFAHEALFEPSPPDAV